MSATQVNVEQVGSLQPTASTGVNSCSEAEAAALCDSYFESSTGQRSIIIIDCRGPRRQFGYLFGCGLSGREFHKRRDDIAVRELIHTSSEIVNPSRSVATTAATAGAKMGVKLKK